MKALDRKLFRDLWHLRSQALAICLVMACGVATFVMSLSMLDSLTRTLDTYYAHHRFGEIFAHLKRAPDALAPRIAEIPGVAAVETRIVERVILDMPGFEKPVSGQLQSLPAAPESGLNLLYLRSGRLIEPGHRLEVLVHEAFAEAHGLQPGDTVSAVLNGRLESLRVAGIVLSPEFVYQIRAGDILPDDEQFGVFWMARSELAPAFDMDGAFNDVTLTLMSGAHPQDVIDRLDALTDRYGGLGAHDREDQVSHRFVSNEIKELRGTAVIVPIFFLGVAAFLLNVVLARLVSTHREQIAALKALGYWRWRIGLHYLELVLLISALAAALGTAVGGWMGAGLTRMYAAFFHFPSFEYHLRPSIVVLAVLVSFAAAVLGAVGGVVQAVRLPPAEAMRPQPPASFRPTLVERLGLQSLLSPATRMILRQLERRPIKSALSCLGVALAVAILVLGSYMEDAIEYALDYEFHEVQRYDLSIAFTEPVSPGTISEVAHLPGVRYCEPFRAVAARLRAGHRSERLGVMGLPRDVRLFRLAGMDGTVMTLPEEGVVLSKKLGEMLAVRPGDVVTVEVLEGSRPVRTVAVAGLLADMSGLSAYMSIEALNRLLREDRVISGAFIAADARSVQPLYETLKETPHVASVVVKAAMIASFRETIAESMLTMKAFTVAFAVIIAFGVVYNGARISLSERSRDLATLRVIGFTRAEASRIQLGELAVITVVAIPLGMALGWWFVILSSDAYDSEVFRMPIVVYRSTYGFAAVVIAIASVLSGLAVRRLIDRLNLVSVLKMRD